MAEEFETKVTVDGKYFLSIIGGSTKSYTDVQYMLGPTHGSTKTGLPFSLGTLITPSSIISSANFPSTPATKKFTDMQVNGTPTSITTANCGIGTPATLSITQVDGKTYSLAFLIQHSLVNSTHYIYLCLGEYVEGTAGSGKGIWTFGYSWYYEYEGPADEMASIYEKLATPGTLCKTATTSDGFDLGFYAYNVEIDGLPAIIGINPGVGTTAFNSAMFKAGTYVEPDEPENPYEPLGPSGPGGGGGTFTSNSDQITIPSQPTLSSAATGFTRIYNPTLSQVNALANYLWTDESIEQTIWNHIKQFFENPMEAMISFNLVPVPVPDGGLVPFKIMYIETGINMNTALSQFVDVNCGTLELSGYYGSALDYSPYTKVSAFLPFIGTVSLNTDEVMGRTLAVAYRIDIVSGNCVAYIMVDGNALYQYSGHCAINIPFSSADFSNYMSACISIAKLGATLITGAASGPQSSSAPSSEKSDDSLIATLGQGIANTVGAVMSSKPHIEHSGSFSGNSGYLGVRRPYLIIERPRACMPADYGKFNGYPCMMNLLLSELSGYTKVQQIQLSNVAATMDEISEILEYLKSGVVI